MQSSKRIYYIEQVMPPSGIRAQAGKELAEKMPKSKRAKVVSLTKVKKRPKEKKDDLIEDIRESCEKFSRVFLVSIENERNQFMQEVRKQLRPGKLVCTNQPRE